MVRTYSLAGTPVAERTNGPTGGNTLRWLGDDNHNTGTIEIVASTGAVTVRYEDPYGNARGANPAWSSGHTFLNDDQATTSGTVTIGARTYDPVIGKFLTVDPVLSPTDPQQNNGYSYAANNPVTLADPTGLDPAMHQCDHSDTAACRDYFYGGAWTDRAPVAPGKTPSSRLGAYLKSTTGVPKNLNIEAANACGWNSVCISQQPDRYAAGPGYHPTPGIADGCHSLKSCAIRLGTVAWGVCLIACGGFGEATDAVGGGILEGQADAAAQTGMTSVRAAGKSGEDLAGIVKNTDRIPSLSDTAAYRIPDELDDALGEVKNVSRLSYTNQLRDFQAYAQQEGMRFNLYVRGSTTLSGPLQQAVDAGLINLVRNLPG